MNTQEGQDWLTRRVSRETMGKLEVLHALLVKWQKTINLVAPSTLESAWARHFADSAQLFFYSENSAMRWLDLGSGAGFPGLVVAAIAAEQRPGFSITLVESDIRKCAFLMEAVRTMKVEAQVLASRIADISVRPADVITARALASLPSLIRYAQPHMHPETDLFFPKGSSYKSEVESLSIDWQNATRMYPSETDPTAVILRIQMPDSLKEI